MTLPTSKFWANTAYLAATYLVVFKDHNKLDWGVILVYLAVVGGSSLAIKLTEMWIKFKSSTTPTEGVKK